MSEYIEISAEEFNEYVDSLEKEIEALKAQVEQLREVNEKLNHFVDVNNMVYEWREIGETDWVACDEEWFVICQLSPNCDTRKRFPDVTEIRAQAYKRGFEACIDASVRLGMIDKDGEFSNQLRQPVKAGTE